MNDFSYGSRARIGLIYPAGGWVMEPEMQAMSPAGVITLTTRVSLLDVNESQLSLVGAQATEAAALLTQAPVSVIALGCTSGSFIGGPDYDQELIREMTRRADGTPCTTTSTAVVKALRALGVKKIAVGTPYIDEVNEKAVDFLTHHGFDVVSCVGLGLIRDIEIDAQPLEGVYGLAKSADTPDAEAVVILCTGIRSVPVLDMLERDLNKPVVSAIQATFWDCLRLSGVKDQIEGFGSLLREL